MERRTFLCSRTFRIWLICYLIVLLLPMGFSGLLYRRQSVEMTRKAYTLGESTTAQIVGTIDEQLKTVYRITDAICSSSEIRKLRYVTLPFDAQKYYQVHQRAKGLSAYFMHTQIVSGMYLYCDQLSCILDSGRIYSRTNQYEAIVRKQFRIEESTFAELMSQVHNHDLYLVGDGERALLLQTVRTGLRDGTPPLTLITVINTDSLTQLLGDVGESWQGSAKMLFPNSAILPSIEDNSALLRENFGPLSLLETAEEDDELIVTALSSNVTYLTYALVVPSKVFFGDVLSGRSFFFYFFLCTLFLGGLVAYMLARLNYRPVHQLKETANIQSDERNEFDVIAVRLRELKGNCDRMQHEIDRLEPIEDDEQFRALLDGNICLLPKKTIERLSVQFNGNVFVALAIESDRDEVSFMNMDDLSSCLGEKLNEKTDQTCQCIVRVIDGKIRSVICFPEGTNPYDAQLYTKKIAQSIISESNNTMNVSIFIGDAHAELDGIGKSYREALRALEYAEFVAEIEKQVVLYDETMYSSCISWENYDIVDAERRCVSLLLENSFDSCEQLIYEIMTYYTGHEGLSLYVMRCRMFSIVNMMLNVIREIEPDDNSTIYKDSKPLERLLTVRTMQELRDAVSEIIDRLRKQHEEPCTNQLEQKLMRIEQYIKSHYFDASLSVQMLADTFDMSLPYLSREFKNSRGMGVLTYINRYRISKAKQFLESNEQMTISEIAEHVGYNSSQTLIRTFKRYEEVTPGQYRITHESSV